MPTLNIQIDKKLRTGRQLELIAMLQDKSVLKQINTFIKDGVNEFVPMQSGALRRSAIVTHKSITWGRKLKYARYQYYGEIYGPNYPGAINGVPAWKSGKSKHPTGRMMGDFTGTLNLRPRWQKGEVTVKGTLPYKFGYTTSGTRHHWNELFKYRAKMKVNQEVTRYLKRECKRRGLKS